MPHLPIPEPPAGQVALRAVVEAALRDHESTASYRHEDRFWESDDGRESVYGWGTKIAPRAAGDPIDVWFDGLDGDVVVWQDDGGPRRRTLSWHEWRDGMDLDEVLADVERVLRTMLSAYR